MKTLGKSMKIALAYVGVIVLAAYSVLYANVDTIANSEIPMLAIVAKINPIFAQINTFVIFALIFNTAFSLSYALAKRFAGAEESIIDNADIKKEVQEVVKEEYMNASEATELKTTAEETKTKET
ncbi:hypothetical protein [Lachnospira multipara]|uniref:hypothetical protein n=1 Tax=Lachnospira multipara TaxID=28051 RepID=UPI0004879059|nr:hypothetical protein [Lachnospira multipara]